MDSVQTGMWDPRPPSKHAAPPPQPHPPNSRPTHVSTATPAKRITFYKSGDSQFGGVRMAVHKRSFKCFDALLDDLSQKVPLPFGVRTVTTPRGTHSIKHLEQLRDGGCYLCSDRRQAKPVNMELARKRPSIWCYDSRRPQRPEASPATPSGHLPHRQRRVLLVKNSEPGMRRSVVLSRRSTRSLRAFLDEVSEVMQFHVRKLYTAEGRRIDSVQSLITCPGVLVCVGREAFSPTLVNFIRKSSEEKLPGLDSRSPGLGPRTPGNGARSPATQGARSPPHGAQSRASEYSEGQESKKNVNFGLETKKSIIHPRSDSSNRSTRFSLSSEKSYSNGVSAYSQAKPAIMNEDIEKRVIVNKDGSLSVEMRVRFRLQNDETLQWSTQIKKSPSLTNECCPLGQAQPRYLQQGQSESCSDPDCTSFEPEGVGYSSQHVQCGSEGSRCPCCHQRREPQYDLWENPAHRHKQPPVPPPHTSSHTHTMRHTHSSSSSSSCNSRRVVRCRAQLSSCRGGSGLERSQLVQEEMCVTEQVERRVDVEQDGNTRVDVCSVSRCHSLSEVVAVDSNLQSSMEGELMMEEEGDRPLSAVSSSSHVLQSLKEDEDDDLPPSASQCCHSNEPSPSPTFHLSDKPTSDVSAVSVHSNKHRKDGDRAERGSRAASVARSCQGEAEPKIPHSEEEGTADDEDEEIKRVVSGVSGYRGPSAGSLQSRASSVCPDCCGCKSGANSDSNSRTSQRSHHSHQASPKPATPLSNQDKPNNCSDDDGSDGSAGSTQSNKTNLTNRGRLSAIANVLEDRESCVMSRTSGPHAAEKEKERAPSATSATSRGSNRSRKHGRDGGAGVPAEKEEERSHGAISAQSNLSAKSSKTYKSNCSCAAQVPDIGTREDAEEDNAVERAPSSKSAKSGASSRTRASVTLGIKVASLTDKTDVEKDEIHETTPRALSVKSNGSDKPSKAERPDSVLSAPGAKAADEAVTEATGHDEGMEAEESNLSATSNKSQKKKKASERSLSPRSETGDGEKRAASQMSGRSVKSNTSVKSSKSRRSNYNGNESGASPSLRVAEEKENETVEEETQQRPGSVVSPELENEESEASTGSSKSHCDENTGVRSEAGDNTGDGEKAEDWAASALSGESASSAKSRRAKCETRVASPAKVTAKLEVDRTPSAVSGRSRTSAKSSKSQKSNCTAASPNPSETDAAAVDKNGEENQKQERVASATSVRSKSSRKSNSSKNLKSASPSPNIVTIRTPEGNDKDGNETTERAPSAASAKSEKSTASALSHKSNPNTAAAIAIIESADADEEVVEDNAPRNKSSEPANSLSPKTCSPRTHSPKAPAGETRGPSALSVHSATSAKSGRSKCRCGAASTLEKAVKEHKGDVEGENEKDNEELQSEEAPEWAASILSSSSKRRRRESGGTEQPLSRNSSGSVSLGLPEDQDAGDSDSGKSSVSFHINTESKSRVEAATPAVPRSADESVVKEDVEGTASIISQKSSINGSKKNHSPPAVNIPAIETPGGSEDKGEEEQKTARATSAFSAKSSSSHRSSCNCSVTAAPQMPDVKPKEQHASASSAKAGNDLETGSAEVASTTKSSNKNVPDNRTLSAMSSASAKVRSKSPASASVQNANVAKTTAGDPENNDAVSRSASKAKGEGDIAGNKAASVHSKSPCCLRPESAASARSGSKMKASKGNKGEDPVKCHKSSGNVKTTTTSSPCPLHSSRPCSKVESCADSILSHSLSAADLLKETVDAARPHGRQCKFGDASDKPRSEKSGRCRRNSNQAGQEDLLDLTPACLPNASPSEVVSDWLRSIPANSGMLALGDGLNEEEEEEEEQGKPVEGKPGVMEEEGSPEDEKGDKEEKVEAEEKEEGVGCDAAEEEKSSDPVPAEAVASSRPDTVLLTGESVARNWNSSAAVMKVLLSSSLGRCRSVPEVSPVYGRRLSTSARGLLDCLAQLQLIEPAVSLGCDQQKNQHYEDITAILQSLWLTEPKNIEAKETKDVGDEQVTPPRSSSGVDMSSGSGGSGRENGIQGGDETKQRTKDTESLQEDEGVEKVVGEEEEGNAEGGRKEIQAELKETPTERAEADTAEEAVQSEERSTVPPSLDSPKDAGTPSSSDKSSANSSSKSPTDNERETLEDSSSGTPPTVLRAPLSKRLSQDPDPVWILNLLKKLEKQFMNHYINAMAEFKVRWDLDDSLILDTMISELREEVSRRIQSSIEREIRKIQGRAGRAGRPRPPQGGNLSRDSIMTEKRRQMLKIMKNQSVKTADSLSDGEMTGEFSDQRSDDEYCPCDACVRKKMAARPLATNPMAAEAPVMMEFDLLKILQLKKSPSPAPAAVTQPAEGNSDSVVLDEEGRNLEVVQEEEEEEEDKTKEDIKADVVLEETIREEDEEMGEEEDCGEAGEEEEVEAKEERGVGDEEHAEGETGDEEAGEEGTSENGEEEEEDEEETECHCQSARKEEECEKEGEEGEESSDNTGEDETKDDEERAGEEEGESADEGATGGNEGDSESREEEEEKSDKETVKEATAVEGDTRENGDGKDEKEEEEAAVEECEASDLKPEKADEEETSSRQSGEESGEADDDDDDDDDGAAKDAANAESAQVEGNASASAEAEDEGDGDAGPGEGESHEDDKGGESEEQGREASEEGRTSPQGQGVTEGEEADGEDSSSPEEKEGGGHGGEEEVVEDAVEEFKPDKEEEEGEVNRNKREDGALLHQLTRTSVESQPGSLEDIDTDSPQNPVSSIEVPKKAAGASTGGGGGAGQWRSRTPARVKRRKPKESDVEPDDF